MKEEPAYSPDEFGLKAQLAEVRREIHYRNHVYERLVTTGKMTGRDADRRQNAMKAVAQTLEKLLEQEEKTRQPTLFQ